MPLGDVAQAELDGIEAGGFGKLVHRVLQHRYADGLARRAHRAGAGTVDAGDLVDHPATAAGVEEVRRLGDRLGEAFAGQV